MFGSCIAVVVSVNCASNITAIVPPGMPVVCSVHEGFIHLTNVTILIDSSSQSLHVPNPLQLPVAPIQKRAKTVYSSWKSVLLQRIMGMAAQATSLSWTCRGLDVLLNGEPLDTTKAVLYRIASGTEIVSRSASQKCLSLRLPSIAW